MSTDRAEELRRRPDIAQEEMSEATRRLREQAWAVGALPPPARAARAAPAGGPWRGSRNRLLTK
jgi:hypothetical protein